MITTNTLTLFPSRLSISLYLIIVIDRVRMKNTHTLDHDHSIIPTNNFNSIR